MRLFANIVLTNATATMSRILCVPVGPFGRTRCQILNMASIFAVLMMPSPMRDGACQLGMIGLAIGTWLRHVAI